MFSWPSLSLPSCEMGTNASLLSRHHRFLPFVLGSVVRAGQGSFLSSVTLSFVQPEVWPCQHLTCWVSSCRQHLFGQSSQDFPWALGNLRTTVCVPRSPCGSPTVAQAPSPHDRTYPPSLLFALLNVSWPGPGQLNHNQ